MGRPGRHARVAAEMFLLPPLMIVMRARLGVPLLPQPQGKSIKTAVKEQPHVEV